MDEKFQRLRRDVLGAFSRDPDDPDGPDVSDLPLGAFACLEGPALEDCQVRMYHLWERLMHFRPGHLDAAEEGERMALAAQVERCLALLHAAGQASSRA